MDWKITEDDVKKLKEKERFLRGIQGKHKLRYLRAFEMDLHDYQRRLRDFVRVLELIDPKKLSKKEKRAVSEFMKSLEVLLQGQIRLLQELEKYIPKTKLGRKGETREEFLKSFGRLLKGLTGLLSSFERLLERSKDLVTVEFLLSLENLLKGLAVLLRSFEKLLNGLLKKFEVDVELLRGFEGLLKSLEKLLESFGGLIKKHAPQNRVLRKSFGKLVKAFESLVKSFHRLKGMMWEGEEPEEFQKSNKHLKRSLRKLKELYR